MSNRSARGADAKPHARFGPTPGRRTLRDWGLFDEPQDFRREEAGVPAIVADHGNDVVELDGVLLVLLDERAEGHEARLEVEVLVLALQAAGVADPLGEPGLHLLFLLLSQDHG